jgi:hypothetical protein
MYEKRVNFMQIYSHSRDEKKFLGVDKSIGKKVKLSSGRDLRVNDESKRVRTDAKKCWKMKNRARRKGTAWVGE